MAKVIKLGAERKRRAREQKLVKAEAQRRKHGRTGADKRLARAEADLAERRLEGHKRESETTENED